MIVVLTALLLFGVDAQLNSISCSSSSVILTQGSGDYTFNCPSRATIGITVTSGLQVNLYLFTPIQQFNLYSGDGGSVSFVNIWVSSDASLIHTYDNLTTSLITFSSAVTIGAFSLNINASMIATNAVSSVCNLNTAVILTLPLLRLLDVASLSFFNLRSFLDASGATIPGINVSIVNSDIAWDCSAPSTSTCSLVYLPDLPMPAHLEILHSNVSLRGTFSLAAELPIAVLIYAPNNSTQSNISIVNSALNLTDRTYFYFAQGFSGVVMTLFGGSIDAQSWGHILVTHSASAPPYGGSIEYSTIIVRDAVLTMGDSRLFRGQITPMVGNNFTFDNISLWMTTGNAAVVYAYNGSSITNNQIVVTSSFLNVSQGTFVNVVAFYKNSVLFQATSLVVISGTCFSTNAFLNNSLRIADSNYTGAGIAGRFVRAQYNSSYFDAPYIVAGNNFTHDNVSFAVDGSNIVYYCVAGGSIDNTVIFNGSNVTFSNGGRLWCHSYNPIVATLFSFVRSFVEVAARPVATTAIDIASNSSRVAFSTEGCAIVISDSVNASSFLRFASFVRGLISTLDTTMTIGSNSRFLQVQYYDGGRSPDSGVLLDSSSIAMRNTSVVSDGSFVTVSTGAMAWCSVAMYDSATYTTSGSRFIRSIYLPSYSNNFTLVNVNVTMIAGQWFGSYINSSSNNVLVTRCYLNLKSAAIFLLSHTLMGNTVLIQHSTIVVAGGYVLYAYIDANYTNATVLIAQNAVTISNVTLNLSTSSFFMRSQNDTDSNMLLIANSVVQSSGGQLWSANSAQGLNFSCDNSRIYSYSSSTVVLTINQGKLSDSSVRFSNTYVYLSGANLLSVTYNSTWVTGTVYDIIRGSNFTFGPNVTLDLKDNRASLIRTTMSASGVSSRVRDSAIVMRDGATVNVATTKVTAIAAPKGAEVFPTDPDTVGWLLFMTTAGSGQVYGLAGSTSLQIANTTLTLNHTKIAPAVYSTACPVAPLHETWGTGTSIAIGADARLVNGTNPARQLTLRDLGMYGPADRLFNLWDKRCWSDSASATASVSEELSATDSTASLRSVSDDVSMSGTATATGRSASEAPTSSTSASQTLPPPTPAPPTAPPVFAPALFTYQVTAALPRDPLSVALPIRVRLRGAFAKGFAVRLARNYSNCDTNATFAGGLAAGNVPASTSSNVVQWTVDDSPSAWVAELRAREASHAAVVCWSGDGGVTWQVAPSREGSWTLRVWRKVPTAVAVPRTVTAGALVRVLVKEALPRRTRAFLVVNATSCSGPSPRNVAPLTASSLYGGEGFVFRPARTAARVYLCVATAPRYDTWSLVPFDADDASVFAKGAERIPTGVAVDGGIAVLPSSVRFRKATVNCTVLIAGAHAECRVELRNRTALPLSPATLRIAALRDGGGVDECPLPALRAVSTTVVAFDWVPQRAGRDGLLALTYLGLPVVIEANSQTRGYYAGLSFPRTANLPGGGGEAPVPWYEQDASLMRFAVQPAFSYLQAYNSTNLLSLAGGFNLSAEWPLQHGVYRFKGLLNGTANGDMAAVTWNRTSSSPLACIQQVVTAPPLAERCRFVAHYYFMAQDLSHEWTRLLGSATVATDGGVARRFALYSYLREVVADGSGMRRVQLGDVFQMEQLSAEVALAAHGAQRVSVTLQIEAAAAGQLYFAEPELRCTLASPAAKTDLHDIAALQRIYQSAGGAAARGLRNWAAGAVFNGDPCTNHWQGVRCRNMRVVALVLDDVGLRGVFPPVRELTMLEELHVARNALTGSFGANNTRLRVVDVAHNLLTALAASPGGAFPYAGHRCIRRLVASDNRIATFPAEVVRLPQLELLDLSRNAMAGTLPFDLSLMGSAAAVHLNDNHFSGPLPAGLPWGALVSLDLSHNRLQGTIPPAWGALQRVQFVDLSKNALSGTVPWALAEGRRAGGLVLRLEDNFLTGVVPRLSARLLDLRRNFFSCPLMRPELETPGSEMNSIVMWGVDEWCDSQSASPGF